MIGNELFPLRVASGKRFCNRDKERKLLKELIKQRRPTVLISPRRYGKTSLIFKVAQELKHPFCAIDFLTSYNDEAICTNIIQSVSELVSELMPINMKATKFIEDCFRGIKATINYKLIKLEFNSSIEKLDTVRQTLETLRGLEKLAGKLKKTVVVLMDEFQRVLETEKGIAIQGSIRNVAQTAQNVAFVFSGSSRHMLSQAFDDPNQPLYMLSEKIILDRIAANDYVPYIQDAAKIKWETLIGANEITRILELSECHPFYVNYLCSKLWQREKPPSYVDDVDSAWRECLISEERRFIEELEKLTITQRMVLKEIAHTPSLRYPTSVEFLTKIKLSSGTLIPVLRSLKAKDIVYEDKKDGVTKVLDPLLKYFLINNSR